MSEAPSAVLTSPEAIRDYVFGGHGIFTLVSRRTGERRTFKVSVPDDVRRHGPYFLALLTGPENTVDYRYLGALWRRGRAVVFTPAKRPGMEAAKGAAAWLARALQAGTVSEAAEFWHEGHCGRCGRTLTDPESIARGIGPVCCGKGSFATADM